MPVIINANEKHPFLPLPGDVSAIDLYRAQHQDIRPLEILVVNLMADKLGTERQLARWLGDTEVQVNLTFAAPDNYIDAVKKGRGGKNTAPAHIAKFYKRFGDIAGNKYDGLIVTGINATAEKIADDPLWPQVKKILAWSETGATSSLFLCWGAQAALKYFHGIERARSPQKTWGVFEHTVAADTTGILDGMPDRFNVPVSRWNEIRAADVAKHAALELVSLSDRAGVGVIAEPQPYDDGKRSYPRRVYVLNHPEYDTDTLRNEYLRDAGKSGGRKPKNYFPDDDDSKAPVNSWRHTGRLYANWVRLVYYATPRDINLVPRPYRRKAVRARASGA
jgi:homoserine O-succinyltransferase